MSLRYRSSRGCIACQVERQAVRPYTYRPKTEAERACDRRYQAKPEAKAKRRAQMARRRETGAIQAEQKAWVLKNPHYHRQYAREWRARNPDYAKQWQAQHPELNRAMRQAGYQRRRARLAGVTRIPYTGAQLAGLFMAYGGRCAYCGHAADQVDHVVPIALGGHDALYNLAPACGRCNRSKHDDTLEEWYLRQPFFALERLEFMAQQPIGAGLPPFADMA